MKPIYFDDLEHALDVLDQRAEEGQFEQVRIVAKLLLEELEEVKGSAADDLRRLVFGLDMFPEDALPDYRRELRKTFCALAVDYATAYAVAATNAQKKRHHAARLEEALRYQGLVPLFKRAVEAILSEDRYADKKRKRIGKELLHKRARAIYLEEHGAGAEGTVAYKEISRRRAEKFLSEYYRKE